MGPTQFQWSTNFHRKVSFETLLQWQERKSFLYRIVTGDEKWICFETPKCRKDKMDKIPTSSQSFWSPQKTFPLIKISCHHSIVSYSEHFSIFIHFIPPTQSWPSSLFTTYCLCKQCIYTNFLILESIIVEHT